MKDLLISVIVPTCHRNDLLARCLDCLAPGVQNLSAEEYEVIVTDDGRRSTAEQMLNEQYPWVRWVQGSRQGPAANRNNGASFGLGKWLAFVDDDCLPDGGWLEAIARVAREGAVDIIEGKTITPDKVDHPFRQGVENLTGDNYWSCNLAIRHDVFDAIGRFDEDFLEAGGEDMEIAHRFRSNGLRTRFLPDALVLHPTRPISWGKLIWRTRLIRWILLYEHKTGRAVPLSAPPLKVLSSLAIKRTIFLMRTTWHLVSRPQPSQWKTRLFEQCWQWLTLPLVLPYLMIWELRFRKLLRSRMQDNT